MCCFLRSNIGYCSDKKQPYLECKSIDECSSNKCVDLKHGHECLGTLFEYDAKGICTGTGAMTEHDIADNNGKNGLDVGAECLDFDFDPNDTFDHPEGFSLSIISFHLYNYIFYLNYFLLEDEWRIKVV